jgi:ABC-type phosphate/phosphonate transport system substrate-binding protein
MAACRNQSASGPVIQATLTPTPRSTPLPPVATTIPPGIVENPIQMVLRPSGNIEVARRLITDAQITDLQDAILEESGLVVEITLVDRHAEALAALCGSTPTNVTVAWLDGLTYQAAMAQGCGSPVLQIERDRQTGDAAQIVAASSLGLAGVSDLNGRSFCRLGYDDYYTWLVPSLLLKSGGVDPVDGLGTITDYDDIDALAEAVADGDCEAAGLSEIAFDDLGNVSDDLDVIATTPDFPYGVLMYPLNLTLGERMRLRDALLSIDADVLRPVLSQDDLTAVDDGDFEELTSFLADTGLDFAQLGN